MPGRKLHQSSSDTSPSNDVSPSIMMTVIILAIAVILSASLYLLLRFLRRHRTTPTTTDIPLSHPSHKHTNPVSPILDSLPLFTYDRLTTRLTGDCAVCLSKFSTRDMLRLLPLCCHAFHKDCIDTWLSSSLTCPLCRTPVLPSDHSGSFRVDIGSVSSRRQRDNVVPNIPSGEIYAISGEFDYVIPADNDVIADIPATSEEYYKEVLASEVGTRGGGGGGGGWLKDYLSSSITSSRTASFRGSGRMFFTGSSRRTELGELDGASRLGEEISELFRWLSGA